jgi:hypothetical protein
MSKHAKTAGSKAVEEKIKIQVLMEPEATRKATGLTKLTPEELLNLNHWLNEHMQLLGPGPPHEHP